MKIAEQFYYDIKVYIAQTPVSKAIQEYRRYFNFFTKMAFSHLILNG